MQTKFINPWASTATKKVFFSVADSDLIYRNGDYSIFEQKMEQLTTHDNE